MKKNIYKLSFEEANKLLNFSVENINDLQKVKESYYVTQKLLIKYDWINLVEDRFSWLFIKDLIESDIKVNSKFNFNKKSILDEIRHLEKPNEFESLTGVQKKFSKKGEFRGLMHKHYYEDSSKGLSKNLLKAFDNKKRRKALEIDLSNLIKEDSTNFKSLLRIIGTHAWKPFKDAYEGKENSLTGEWIIFFEHHDTKYYLALWGHDLDDSIKAKQIHEFCKVEYPELNILEHLNI